ncbi:hypothetical protein TTHERM_00622780 (macronuclear) [Tetrahymena thermophila SB210]|uniref:Uncharacterized protein n=1 Tax=Tetrahymena thermophila (strain SB210) TaxID=312017 RepID=Q241A6_TETTS|nr:hypothetical protein TTHERM_00622780 [Tetrahymena thermophila SB210]EAS02258.1 hypothetical protein TTHERM_00622780 [Tetrahymena thermophila SB210]|eukprot:XP_001022503.1 hypothetical protein TTHERM_00622780 [Tetrahymena thermophila SB210]
MELLLADKLGYPKGFNGFEWSSLPGDGIKKSQMPSYLVEDLPNTDGFSIRQKFKEVSFAEAPKIEFFKPFIKSNYEIFRKDQQKKQKIKQLRQMKKDEKYMKNFIKREELKQYSVDLQQSVNQDTCYMSQNQQSENVLDKFISLTPTIQAKPNNSILSMIKGKIIQERKEKKEKEKKKQQLIDDLHYYKIFADKYSRLTIECVDNIYKLIGDNQGSQATDSDQKIDDLRDSQIIRDNLQRSEQNLKTLQERGSCLSQMQQQQQKNQLEDIIESKEQQHKVSIDNSHNLSKVNVAKDIIVSRTSQIPYSQNSNKSNYFLEVEINENKMRDNGNLRSRNSTLSQMAQNQEVKTYSSTMYGNSNQQQKRVSLINQLQNQQNKLDDSLKNFFKGDGILYKTFQRNKSQSKSHKNNSSFLQSTANTNLNFTNKTPSSKQNQLSTSNNNVNKNTRSVSSEIQINSNISKTPKQFSKTQNNFNNRFLTPQKVKQIDKQSYTNTKTNQYSHVAHSINYENSYETKQLNKNYQFLNQNSLYNTTNYKKDYNQSKTPKEQSSFLSTKNRYLTPDKKSIIDQSITSNYQDINIRKSINYDFEDQQSCYMTLKQNPNKQMKNNYINPSKNIGNTQDKNQESPTFTNYTHHSENKNSLILNNIRSKRESQIQNDKNNMSYIDPQFQEKSDVHHRSVMYAMKTLKKKFGLNKEKVQNKSSKLD